MKKDELLNFNYQTKLEVIEAKEKNNFTSDHLSNNNKNDFISGNKEGVVLVPFNNTSRSQLNRINKINNIDRIDYELIHNNITSSHTSRINLNSKVIEQEEHQEYLRSLDFDTFGNERGNIKSNNPQNHNITANYNNTANTLRNYYKENSCPNLIASKNTNETNNHKINSENISAKSINIEITPLKELSKLTKEEYNEILNTYDQNSLIDTLIRQKKLIDMNKWQIDFLNEELKNKEDYYSTVIKELELNISIDRSNKDKKIEYLEERIRGMTVSIDKLNNDISLYNSLFKDNDINNNVNKCTDYYQNTNYLTYTNDTFTDLMSKFRVLIKRNESLTSEARILKGFIENFNCYFNNLNELLLKGNNNNVITHTKIYLNIKNKEFISNVESDYSLTEKDFDLDKILKPRYYINNNNNDKEDNKEKRVREDNFTFNTNNNESHYNNNYNNNFNSNFKGTGFSNTSDTYNSKSNNNADNLFKEALIKNIDMFDSKIYEKIKIKLIIYQRKIIELVKKASLVIESNNSNNDNSINSVNNSIRDNKAKNRLAN